MVENPIFHCPRCGVYFDNHAPESLINEPQTRSLRYWLKQNIPSLFFFLKKHRNIVIKKYKYYSLKDLTDDSFKFVEKIPNDFDIIIGLPRAGLIVSTIIATEFGRPLSTPDDFIQGIMWKSRSVKKPSIKKVLLVDEIMSSGRNMREAIQKIKQYDSSLVISTAALIQKKGHGISVDYNLITVKGKVIYEWESVKEEYL